MRPLLPFIFLLFTLFASGQDGESYAPIFSVPGGIYQQGFDLTLTSNDPNAAIYYTTDGSKPRSGSRTYSRPINISKIRVIRAIAYVNGKPSEIVSHSYFLGREYTIPIVSITTDSSNFWSVDRGIYVKGLGGLPNYPYRGANYWKNWGREINVEYYETDGTCGFNQRAEAKIFGGWSRPLPQKSLAIFAKKEYGDKYFHHKVFRDKDLKKFSSLVLRNSGSDFNKTQFRDAFMTSLVRDIDLEIQAYQPVAVYINGNYWGVQNLREKINEQYVKFNCGADPDSVDMMKHRDDVKAGTRKHYSKMMAYMRTHDLSNQTYFDSVAKLMDVYNYAHYNIVETYVDNHDAGGNIRYWRPQTPDGRWRWVLFDTDFGFGIGNWKAYKVNTLAMFTDPAGPKWPNPPWSTYIIRKLLENDDFRRHYINQFADHLNTIFHPDVVNAQLDFFEALYEGEMPHHFERWGGNMERWGRSLKVMHDFGTNRPTYVRKHIMQKFALKDTAFVTIDADSVMGKVKLNTLKLKQFPWTGIYFEGNEITVTAIPYFDYEFVGWEGHESTERVLVIDPKEDLQLKAIFKKKPNSGNHQAIRINEIGFDLEKNKGYDWVELYNTTEKPLDISGWMFMDKKDKNQFLFPEGTVLNGGDYLVLCQDLDSFRTKYSDTIVAIAGMDFGLSSKGELIRLYDAAAMMVDSLSYEPQKGGKDKEKYPTLGLNNPKLKGHEAKNWSGDNKGTPGGINKPFADELAEAAAEEQEKKVMLGSGAGFLGLLVIVVIIIAARRRKRKRNSNEAEVTY